MTFEMTQAIIDKPRFQKIIDNALSGSRKIDSEKLSLQDWLSIRAMLGLGASEVAAALGINQYTTPFEVWKSKVSDEINLDENDYMIFGNVVEPAIIEWYNKRTKSNAVKDHFIRIHPEHDCLFANLDGVIFDDKKNLVGMVECKSTTSTVYKSWEENQEDCVQGIPLYHYCQVQHELSITGLPWCDLAILITDRRQLKIKRIERDEAYIQKQNEALVLWWQAHVVAMIPPDMTAGELGHIQPEEGSFIEATPEIEQKISDLKTAKEEEKLAKKKVEGLEEEIKLFIGDKENITSNGNIVATWKNQTQARIDSDLLKKEEPETFDRFKKIISFRVLRLKK